MPAFSTLVDSFNGTAFDAKWSINQLNAGFPDAGEAVVSGGAAILRNTNTTAFDNDVSIDTTATYDLTGSYVYAKFELSAITVGNYSTDLALTIDPQPNALPAEPTLGFYTNRSATATALGMYVNSAAGGVDTFIEIPYSATDHAWLRIINVGADILFQTAPDSAGSPGAWTTRLTRPVTDFASGITSMRLKIAYRLGTGGASAVGSAALTVRSVNTRADSVTHDTTAVLVAGRATATGAANRFRAMSTSGVLAAGQATTVGSAAKNIPHGTSGALEAAQGAMMVGANAIKVYRDTTGVLRPVAGASTGSAARTTVHGTAGALAGSGARTARSRPTTGALPGGLSSLIGRASRTNPANLESIQDAFDAAAVDTTTLWDLSAPAGSTVTQANGKLVFTHTADTTKATLTSKATKRLTGNRVYARLAEAVVVPTNLSGALAGLEVELDANNRFSWYQISDGTIQAQKKVAGTTTDNVILSYTPATHAWIAVSERGGTVYWESAPSSAQDPPLEGEWVTRYSAAPGFAITSLKVRLVGELYFASQSGMPTQHAKFDSINTQTRASVAHATSGVLVGPGALGAGPAAKKIVHDATGVLVAPAGSLPAGGNRYHDHPSPGALQGGSAIMSGIGSTSDVTRKVWIDKQDTGGAWINPPAPEADPWTPRPDSDTSWGT